MLLAFKRQERVRVISKDFMVEEGLGLCFEGWLGVGWWRGRCPVTEGQKRNVQA